MLAKTDGPIIGQSENMLIIRLPRCGAISTWKTET